MERDIIFDMLSTYLVLVERELSDKFPRSVVRHIFPEVGKTIRY